MIPTSTDVSFEISGKAAGRSASAVAAFVVEGAKNAGSSADLLTEEQRRSVARLLGADVAHGKLREVRFDLYPSGGAAGRENYTRVFVVGVGKEDKVSAENLRQAAGALARVCRKQKLRDVSIVVPAVDGVGIDVAAEAIVTGFLLASFQFDEMKGTGHKKTEEEANGDGKPVGRTAVTLLSDDPAGIRTAVNRGRVIGDAQNFARTIASRPGNVINPPALAKVATDMAKEVGLGVRVLDEKQMSKLGMGGILAVGGASATPPRIVALEHRVPGSGSRVSGTTSKTRDPRPETLLVVGKAITFDTGGISIKPSEKMGKMVYDKCGAMAVLGFMYAVAKLKLDVPVVGILSSAENTLGGSAYRPGDILTMHNGVTVEVTNTDAEGRLVLGDALAWGIDTYKPSAVVDLATLTGGVVVALGTTMAGVMSNSDSLVGELQNVAESTCEKFWRLPLNDDHRDYIKSHHADIVNSGGREGSPLQGGAFLSFFVPRDDSVPWAHVDIAGVADTDKELPYYGKGATGWGVRTLVEWAARKAK